METKDFELMDEKLLAIVDFGREKKFYIVDPSDSEYLSSSPFPVIFQPVLVYDPVIFQSQLDSLLKPRSTFNPSNN